MVAEVGRLSTGCRARLATVLGPPIATRVNAAVMKDKRLAGMMDAKAMPFDAKRMIYGGFKVMVDL